MMWMKRNKTYWKFCLELVSHLDDFYAIPQRTLLLQFHPTSEDGEVMMNVVQTANQNQSEKLRL